MSSFQFHSSIWLTPTEPLLPEVIDQRYLPFESRTFIIRNLEGACYAIREMVVRGAPLIGVTAAYGMYVSVLDCRRKEVKQKLTEARNALNATRPTAVNLFNATRRMMDAFSRLPEGSDILGQLLYEANLIKQKEVDACRKIGEYGLTLIEELNRKNNGKTINILTHCNAGWLACVEWGTALAPVYMAHQKGIPVHVWVDETRPRNQGARLTAFELGQAGVPHTVIPDNTGGHLMHHGKVDMVIVGSDRTTRNGDVANKIGTYLKALAAADNGIPFYVALPVSTFDPDVTDGIKNIPIEERDASEVECIEGWNGRNIEKVKLIPEGSRVANYGFDITPARLVTALITDRGIIKPDTDSIARLFNS